MTTSRGCEKQPGGCTYPSCHCDTPLVAPNKITPELRAEAEALVQQAVKTVAPIIEAAKATVRWDGITFGDPEWPCLFAEPKEKYNGNDERYRAGRSDGWQEGWNACVAEVRKLNQPKTEKQK